MRLELDDEVTDAIVVATLKEHIKYAKDTVKKLKKKKKLEQYEQQDLGYNVHLLEAMETVNRYFGSDQ
jgi:hypothetical protein